MGDDLLETLLNKNKAFNFIFFYKGLVILIALHSRPFKESVEWSQFEYHVFVNIFLLALFQNPDQLYLWLIGHSH